MATIYVKLETRTLLKNVVCKTRVLFVFQVTPPQTQIALRDASCGASMATWRSIGSEGRFTRRKFQQPVAVISYRPSPACDADLGCSCPDMLPNNRCRHAGYSALASGVLYTCFPWLSNGYGLFFLWSKLQRHERSGNVLLFLPRWSLLGSRSRRGDRWDNSCDPKTNRISCWQEQWKTDKVRQSYKKDIAYNRRRHRGQAYTQSSMAQTYGCQTQFSRAWDRQAVSSNCGQLLSRSWLWCHIFDNNRSTPASTYTV